MVDNFHFTFSLLGPYLKDRHVLITVLLHCVDHIFPLILNFVVTTDLILWKSKVWILPHQFLNLMCHSLAAYNIVLFLLYVSPWVSLRYSWQGSCRLSGGGCSSHNQHATSQMPGIFMAHMMCCRTDIFSLWHFMNWSCSYSDLVVCVPYHVNLFTFLNAV